MNAVMIDTHKSVKALTNANLTEVQAEVIVNLMTDALGNNLSNLATKEDIGNIIEVTNELRQDVDALKQDVDGLKQDVDIIKEDIRVMKQDIIGIKTEMVHLEDRIDHKLTKLELSLTIRMAVMLVGILGAFKAAEKFFELKGFPSVPPQG